jgi:periplasmic mercuric ion binding protein
MKTVKLFVTVLITVVLCMNISAQTNDQQKKASTKTEIFKVWGNCDMCKTRIEKAVKAAGATSADWNTESKMLTVSFNPAKTNVDLLDKKLASVGHDTEKYKADDKIYNALPACCKYERNK